MPYTHLLYKNQVSINDHIKIVIPTVGDIIKDEDSYYSLVSCITAMPIDLIAQLDEVGIDFSTINEYELFLMTFPGLAERDTSLLFGDLDLSKFKIAVNEQNGNVILLDDENDIKIDRAIHGYMADVLRKIHHLDKDRRKPANKEAKDYMVQRAKEKAKRRRRKKPESQLEPLIVALVNTEQFKYDFDSVKNISIYQFNESLKQIVNKVEYDNRMYGVYTGTIDTKKLSQSDFNWLIHK